MPWHDPPVPQLPRYQWGSASSVMPPPGSSGNPPARPFLQVPHPHPPAQFHTTAHRIGPLVLEAPGNSAASGLTAAPIRPFPQPSDVFILSPLNRAAASHVISSRKPSLIFYPAAPHLALRSKDRAQLSLQGSDSVHLPSSQHPSGMFIHKHCAGCSMSHIPLVPGTMPHLPTGAEGLQEKREASHSLPRVGPGLWAGR